MDRITCVCLLGVVSFITAVPNSALAKPKQLVNGCSVEQIQSNFGNSCVDQMQQDLINNRSYTHALLCNGSEMLCCTYDNATGGKPPNAWHERSIDYHFRHQEPRHGG